MTQTPHRRPRTPAELFVAQLAGIDSWRLRARAAETPPASSREVLLVQRRRADVLARQHEALVARTSLHLQEAGNEPLLAVLPVRAVVGHRHAWFRDGLVGCLLAAGVDVTCTSDNGAEVIGVVTAEQPDLLVLDSNLAMVPSAEVAAELRVLSPGTLVAAQADAPGAGAALLAAGADVTFRRGDSAAAVARTCTELLDGMPQQEYAVAT